MKLSEFKIRKIIREEIKKSISESSGQKTIYTDGGDNLRMRKNENGVSIGVGPNVAHLNASDVSELVEFLSGGTVGGYGSPKN